jgi:hypothetical protein
MNVVKKVLLLFFLIVFLTPSILLWCSFSPLSCYFIILNIKLNNHHASSYLLIIVLRRDDDPGLIVLFSTSV